MDIDWQVYMYFKVLVGIRSLPSASYCTTRDQIPSSRPEAAISKSLVPTISRELLFCRLTFTNARQRHQPLALRTSTAKISSLRQDRSKFCLVTNDI